jgi:hypothetical protein
MWMLFSSGRPTISWDIELLDKLSAAREGNCSHMMPTSCKD